MLICKSSFDVKLVDKANTRSYEYATWKLSYKKKTVTLTGIYHPPPKGKVTNGMFIDDLTVHLTELLTNKHNNIILGDFNMHVDDPNDTDAGIFLDTITAFDLTQHVSMATN